ncbi:MAG TPA: ATPase, T2SS/T4P/T4SS family, partial [Iamia sp.]|nr:ATPase, T2SS/T4P/T4SS family [Iamia sp.]
MAAPPGSASPGAVSSAEVEAEVHRRVLVAPSIPAAVAPGAIEALVREVAPHLPPDGVIAVARRVRARATGLGVIEPLLADPTVTEVMVNGPGAVWVERAGRLVRTEVHVDRPTIDRLVARVLMPTGGRADRSRPLADARLPDGSRVHVVVPPLAVDGPCITIRRFGARAVALDEVAGPAVADLLRLAVAQRRQILVSGGAGAGKTTLLNALAGHIDPDERI